MIDFRQHLVQEASRFPAELNRAFKGMEIQSNPWGVAASERFEWARNLGIPTLTENPHCEYLYYVGCGGSFDSSNRKATIAFSQLLLQAKVSFAVLGQEELCNGETARRLGNEYLFQTMAEKLVGVFAQHSIKKILVNCPHCFNALKNDYPQMGGTYEVIHAAAFVGELHRKGLIRIQTHASNEAASPEIPRRVVYHDSCYYGRYNQQYDEPRALINATEPHNELVEISAHCRRNGTCCGAGGGRMWMEEKKDQRVNFLRTEQALEHKPDVIATSCPFCKIMIGSALNEKGLGQNVAVLDVMELVAEAAQLPTSPTLS